MLYGSFHLGLEGQNSDGPINEPRNSLLNNYDVNNEDEAYEHIDIISDSLVNVYNYGLAKWLCEDVSRGYFDSSSEISSIYEVNHSESIYGVIMKRQYEEIYTMASKIVDYCS